jgi:protein-L-isoaspartate(D-aspartate) O-methyltransferase
MTEMEGMLFDIEQEIQYTRRMTGRAAFAPAVLAALREVPREAFVPAELHAYAYANGPLPIGYGQTISQPYIVALMTDLLEPRPEQVMLEVGTGSGYQAAVLSRLVRRLYSIEIVEPLHRQAAARLQALGYDNIECRLGNGYHGLPEQAPFDGIIVTAGATHVPPALVEQLKPGARLVIPVGNRLFGQQLLVLEKGADGTVSRRDILAVAFVPLTGEATPEAPG